MSEVDEDMGPEDARDLLRWSKEAQRNIDFIITKQAQFSADIERINEIQTRTASVVDQLATVTFRRFQSVEGDVNNLDAKMAALVDSHIRLNDAQERGEGKMDALADSHIRLSDAHERFESKIDALAVRLTESHERLTESQKKSDERLDAFINTVERLISERRNGGRGSEGF
jgi:chromosome segregation ATPase